MQLGQRAVQVRIGRATLSVARQPSKPRFTVRELVDEGATLAGWILCNGAHDRLGLDLMSAHGISSALVATSFSPLAVRVIPPAFVVTMARTGRLDIALRFLRAWIDADDDLFSQAAIHLALMIKLFDARLSPDQRAQLESFLARLPYVADVLTPEHRLTFADSFATGGSEAYAIEQFETAIAASEGAVSDDVFVRFATVQERAGRYEDAASTFARLVHRSPERDEWRRRYGLAALQAGSYAIAAAAFVSLRSQRLMGEAWVRALMAHLAGEAAEGVAQARQPAGAEAVVRECFESTSRSDQIDAFRRATLQDALAPDAWHLYLRLALERTDDLPFGVVGVVPVALLAWDDAEWWAVVISLMLRERYVEGFLRTVECALSAIGDDFAAMIQPGGSAADYVDPRAVGFVDAVCRLRSAGHALCVVDGPPVDDDTASFAITPAPDGYRVHDVDLPPVETWCPAD